MGNQRKVVSLQAETKNVMRYDLLKPVSQRSNGTQVEENRRIAEVADELRRSCQLYEAQFPNGKGNVNALEVEQHCAEQYAKEHGCWIPIERIGNLGEPGQA
jgi:hypothetical protein